MKSSTPNLFQSPAWETFQKSLGKKTFTAADDGWSYLATLETTPVGPYLELTRGPFTTDPSALEPALASLKTLAKAQNAIFIRLEPELDNPLLGTLKKVKSNSPEHTWLLDLTPDQATIISGFSQGTRTRYNNFAKKGLSVTTTKDPAEIKHLVSLQKLIAAGRGFTAYPEKYLRTELEQPFTTLYLVHFEGQVVAASLMFDYQDTRYYMQSAADPTYRKLPATVALLTTAIFDARSAGAKFFDFWGITTSDDPSHPWHGFTEFKKSFGGHQVTYPGTFDLIQNPAKYRLYSLLRPVNRTIRRVIKRH